MARTIAFSAEGKSSISRRITYADNGTTLLIVNLFIRSSSFVPLHSSHRFIHKPDQLILTICTTRDHSLLSLSHYVLHAMPTSLGQPAVTLSTQMQKQMKMQFRLKQDVPKKKQLTLNAT
jgi:hypothetical protein